MPFRHTLDPITRPRLWGSVILLALVAGCTDAPAPPNDMVPPEDLQWPQLACDPLVPSYCGFPFPSNVYTVEDETTPTGRRLALDPEIMPDNLYGVRADPAPWNKSDGFSPAAAIATHVPGVVDLAGFPTPLTIEASLAEDCPSTLLDAESGEKVPHWVELDMTGTDAGQRAIMIRPAVRLGDGRRYIAALSGLRDAAGDPVPASDVFAALRDRTSSDEPSVDERRELYGDIFARLTEADVDVATLQLAWDFTTASRENNTGWLLHMRDEAFALVGEDGPDFEIVSVETDADLALSDPGWETDIAYRIFGTMSVPLYLTQPDPPAQMNFGPDGLPDPNPSQPWADFDFEVIIPHSAVMAPAGIIQYGHGLLGEKEQIESEHFRTFCNQYGYVMMGIDFVGMAADDEIWIGAMLDSGNVQDFQNSVDRQHQGVVNSLLAMRMMARGFAQHPDYGAFVDPTRLYYHGISQGGIFGGTYMGLTTDVVRGALGVPGMPYNLLLSRSVDFDTFFEIMRGKWSDARDHVMLLELVQILWDRTEPNGFVPHIRENMLPGTPSHEVFINAAIGDHQVTTLGAHLMARSLAAQHLDTGLRDIWGLEKVAGPIAGAAYVEYDFGLPPEPVENLPQRECEDPHGKIRKLEEFRQQLDLFYRTGSVQNFCAAGVCTFPDMSGC